MFTTIDQLKEFIIWAKSEKIQQVKVNNVEVTFSTLALIEDTPISQSLKLSPPNTTDAEKLKQEENDLLFHSSI